MAESVNILVDTTLLCHYGETNGIFPIGGLVQPNENWITAATRHCGHLVNFRIEQNDRLYIAKVLDGFMNHEPVKITILIVDVLCGRLKWRARHHIPALVVAVIDCINEVVVALEKLPRPIPPLDPLTSLTTEICGMLYNFSIYPWDNFYDKSKCFDYGEFVSAREIEDNICVDDGIVPTLMDNIPMRDYGDSNNIWTKLVKILRSKIFDRNLQIKGPVSTTSPLANMSQFLQKLENCSGENAEIWHNHLKQSKLKIKGFGIDPTSCEVVTVAVSSFTGHLGN